ncbi:MULTISPECIES: hypothetical protein [Streptomyces]|uniref:Toxin-antitoxin system, toxin component n=1 Tax=Streptomyces doudnae TaxID=3075536 RepID=A0ABD5EIL2_9ACTN|nr:MULTISPECIES: hypothetical protein [unclassified Streptomyces]MDT0433889.1 toxin-antitoxin system, toxin component [Streptomyces sp. DSM 41981]MYQ64681.1 toxin-antitoxin system, toxin component [Streptomyces sp. SID4950]SCD84028.1 hypothetical protein GA0115242_115736 [Streptomyces sp. SolWspMP-5a-2]
MKTARQQKRLIGELAAAVAEAVDVPAEPRTVFAALCAAMSARRGGRPVVLLLREFPAELENTTTGLWLDLKDQDVVVIEERLAPDHQLVVLGHELWHLHAGHRGHDLGGAAVAARAAMRERVDWDLARGVAARAHSQEAGEVTAERFGLTMGARLSGWLADPARPRPADDVARRLSASLGYNGPQG